MIEKIKEPEIRKEIERKNGMIEIKEKIKKDIMIKKEKEKILKIMKRKK